MTKQHHPLSLLLLHFCLHSSFIVTVLAFSCYRPLLHHHHSRQHDVAAKSCGSQRHSHTHLKYSSTSKSSSSPPLLSNNNIKVSLINSNHDILSLADMRYQEWMASDPNPPSIHNFRMATVDIYRERWEEGALVFLAKMNNDDKNSGEGGGLSVGAAELSPIEVKDVIISPPHDDDMDTEQQQQQHRNKIRYVTDVVTSSSSRRQGVGSILMNAVEKAAWELGTRVLLLHVEIENDMARRFYEKLNYLYVDGDVEVTTVFVDSGGGIVHAINIDTNRLAENAGTTGQLLMMKVLSEPVVEKVASSSDASLKGFGKQTVKRKKIKTR